tara:strand:- start:9630 stop:9998 length:369 start_codon:yes stop_codon:yes gene_type:complete
MPMKDGKPIPYQDGGGAKAKEEVVKDKKSPTLEEMLKAVQSVHGVSENTAASLISDPEALKRSYDAAMEKLGEMDSLTGRNMGGVVQDELGYMGGGVSYSDRGPIKYSKGGAVKGKNFKGSF